MNTIQTIIRLMQPELNETQLYKLKIVLETVLAHTRDSLPNEDLLEKFCESKRLVGAKETTLAAYKRELIMMADYYVGKNYTEFTTADLKEYLAKYQKDHKIAGNTLQTKIHILSSFYDYLVTDEFMDVNPTRRIERVMVEKKIKKAFTDEEIERMRDACEDLRDRAFLEFLYSTGARISEVLNLKVSSIDFLAKEVVVFGKGHKERVVYLSDTAVKHLTAYLEDKEAEPMDYVFTHLATNQKMTIRTAQLILLGIANRSGVEHVHPHRFRRTMATHALERGMSIEQIKEILGHSRIDTTMIYCNVNAEKVKESFHNCFQ